MLLVERTEYLGSTTAVAATSWVPLSKPGWRGPTATSERGFLDRAVGARARALRAFLANGHKAVARLGAAAMCVSGAPAAPGLHDRAARLGATRARD